MYEGMIYSNFTELNASKTAFHFVLKRRWIRSTDLTPANQQVVADQIIVGGASHLIGKRRLSTRRSAFMK